MKLKYLLITASLLFTVSLPSFAEKQCGIGYIKKMRYYTMGPEQGVQRHKVDIILDTQGIAQPSGTNGNIMTSIFLGDSSPLTAYSVDAFKTTIASLQHAMDNRLLVRTIGNGSYCQDTVYNIRVNICDSVQTCSSND